MIKNKDKYYHEHEYLDFNSVISCNKKWNVFVTTRGCSKTFGCLKWRLNQFRLHGKKTLWVMQNNQQIEQLDEFWNRFLMVLRSGEMHLARNWRPELTLKLNKNSGHAYADGKEFMTFLSLSVGRKYAGATVKDAHLIDTIVVDEFLPNIFLGDKEPKGVINNFFNIVQTIKRTDPYRVVLLGNPYTRASSWFDHLKVNFIRHPEWFNCVVSLKNTDWALYYGAPFKHKRHMQKSDYGKMSSGISLNQSSIDGDFFLDNDDLIIDPRQTIKNRPICTFKLPEGHYGLWFDDKTGYLVVSKTVQHFMYPLITVDEHTATKDSTLIKGQKGTRWWKIMQSARINNMIRYEDPQILNLFIDLWDKFLI